MALVSDAERHDEMGDLQLRLFTVDDPRLWESRPQLSPEEFAVEGLSDEEWEAFHATIAQA